MTVAELKYLLAGYHDDMELYIVAEEIVGDRRLLFGVHDSSDYERKVFLTGRLSKLHVPKDINPRLDLH
jgi:hypothetical protein